MGLRHIMGLKKKKTYLPTISTRFMVRSSCVVEAVRPATYLDLQVARTISWYQGGIWVCLDGTSQNIS